jgi:hypothetical protein
VASGDFFGIEGIRHRRFAVLVGAPDPIRVDPYERPAVVRIALALVARGCHCRAVGI